MRIRTQALFWFIRIRILLRFLHFFLFLRFIFYLPGSGSTPDPSPKYCCKQLLNITLTNSINISPPTPRLLLVSSVVDPYHRLTDPDAEPALFVSTGTFKMPTKNHFFSLRFFCLFLFGGTSMSFFQDKKSKKSQNSRSRYYFCLMMEGSGSGSTTLLVTKHLSLRVSSLVKHLIRLNGN
jgi:hypothetical protein